MAPYPDPNGSRGGMATPVTPKANKIVPGSAQWKTMTAARWHQHHPYAGQEGVDPVTGQPVMKSMHQIRAEANAAAWKSISAMQAALPSDAAVNAPFDAQRAAIAPLVQAHRDWLERAGQYQVQMANQLGAAAGAAGSGADTAQQGAAGAAGAAPGTTFAGNVSPTAMGAPAAYGSVFGAYLSSLLPSATAMGIGNQGLVNEAQNKADADLNTQRAAITGQIPKLMDDAFTNQYGLAFDQYKSELAALADKGKTSLDVAKFKELTKYHTGLLGLSDDRNAIAGRRADAAIAAAGPSGARTAGDASGLRSALIQADLVMHPKPTSSKASTVPSRYAVVYTKAGFTDPNSRITTPTQRKVFGGDSAQAVRDQVNAWLHQKGHDPDWTPATGKLGIIAPVPGYTKTKTTPTGGGGDLYALRQRAWGILVAANNASLHPMDVDSLKALFRAQEGAPK